MPKHELRPGDPVALLDGRQAVPIAAISRSTSARRATVRISPRAIDIRAGDLVRRMRIRDATAQAITAVVIAEALTAALAVWFLRWTGGSHKRAERNRQ